MTDIDYCEILDRRLKRKRGGAVDVRSRLQHFALINYAVPKSRLIPHIPTDRFEIPEFMIDGKPSALMSAVPFFDVDFHFIYLFPFVRFSFGQTNYRVYVIDRKTGEHCAWFFGTTLGSPLVNIATSLWKIPWHHAYYNIDCRYQKDLRKYATFAYKIRSPWASADIQIEDTGHEILLPEGFGSMDELMLILTHPVDGYFYRKDGQLGTYSVWHRLIRMTEGRPRHLYFSLYEKLGLLSREEMQHPHSIFVSHETEFRVLLPPKVVK